MLSLIEKRRYPPLPSPSGLSLRFRASNFEHASTRVRAFCAREIRDVIENDEEFNFVINNKIINNLPNLMKLCNVETEICSSAER